MIIEFSSGYLTSLFLCSSSGANNGPRGAAGHYNGAGSLCMGFGGGSDPLWYEANGNMYTESATGSGRGTRHNGPRSPTNADI